MRLLVIGGTQFIGRHVVATALARGDDVTLFNRGRTNSGLFPEAEHRIGDRDGDLSALANGEWDATIDTSAYVPRQVHRLAECLGARVGHYVYISSVSAYAPPDRPGGTEDLPLVELKDPSTEQVTDETYGGLKALCEHACADVFGESVTIILPTYVAGPYDHTYRFTYWVERLARGGQVLAPGPADNPFQMIDVRDLASFVSLVASEATGGAFHTVNPSPPFSFGDFLDTIAGLIAPAGTELVWAEADWLKLEGLTERELPLWAATDPDRYISALDPNRAVVAGLSVRSLADTVNELHAHELDAPSVREGSPGLAPAREEELLAKC
jgi:2'-hydroxyisoflavone reductase